MKTCIALRHVPFEDLGTLAPRLARRGYEFSYRDAAVDDFGAPDIAAADLLIVLGGPIGAYEEALYPFLMPELKSIETRLRADKPTLGICLGSQLMARALGARVYPGGAKEIGWSALTLRDAGRRSSLAALGDAPVLHWHGDTFDLPRDAVLLASTAPYAHQAYEWGRNALALQFHIEVTASGLERWYIGHAAELAGAKIEIPRLRADSEIFAPRLAPLAERSIDAWLESLA